jgi:hypothetical protein
VDTTPPTIGDNADMTVEGNTTGGAIVTFSNPAASDIVDASVDVSCSLASGSFFPLGTTTVTCTATDDSGNSSSSSFNVTVVDTTPPTIGTNPNITVEGNTTGGAFVSYTVPTASDIVDASVDVSCSLASGSFFPLGTTTVTCTATDDSGNSSSSSFNVTVVDTTPPTIGINPNITVLATSSAGAVVSFGSPSASDIVDPSVSVVCSFPSGSTFPIGVTTVVCTATDDSGNSASSSFTVTVNLDFEGFFNPIPNRIQNGQAFKSGSTIPVKFQLKDASGNLITDLASSLSVKIDGLAATATGGTALRWDSTSSQYVFNLKTTGLSAGSHTISLCYNGTAPFDQPASVTVQLRSTGWAAAVVVATDGSGGSSGAGEVLAGDLALLVDNSGGSFSAEQVARITEAVAGLNSLLGPYGASITVVDASYGDEPNIRMAISTTSVLGGQADGFLGVTTSAGDITLISGWDWYAGADAAAIGTGQYDFQTIITHELGHSVGLGHSSDASSVMYATLATGAARRSLTAADLAAAAPEGDGSGLHMEALYAGGLGSESGHRASGAGNLLVDPGLALAAPGVSASVIQDSAWTGNDLILGETSFDLLAGIGSERWAKKPDQDPGSAAKKEPDLAGVPFQTTLLECDGETTVAWPAGPVESPGEEIAGDVAALDALFAGVVEM